MEFQAFMIFGFWLMSALSSYKEMFSSSGAYVTNLGSKLSYILYDLMVKTSVLALHLSFWLNWAAAELKGISPRGAQCMFGDTVKLPDDIMQKPDSNPACSSIFGKAFHEWRAESF